MIEDSRKEEGTHKGLRNNKEEVLFDNNKYTLKPIWKKDVGNYL